MIRNPLSRPSINELLEIPILAQALERYYTKITVLRKSLDSKVYQYEEVEKEVPLSPFKDRKSNIFINKEEEPAEYPD